MSESDEELRDQITKIAIDIEKIEQTAKQKKIYFTNKCNEEFDPKIRELGEQLLHQQAILNELLKNINELTVKKKELVSITKKLESECSSLNKEKEKILNHNFKAIEKEKKTKTKDIDIKIKLIEKELKAREKK
jgi:hypothetical protein